MNNRHKGPDDLEGVAELIKDLFQGFSEGEVRPGYWLTCTGADTRAPAKKGFNQGEAARVTPANKGYLQPCGHSRDYLDTKHQLLVSFVPPEAQTEPQGP